MKPLSTSSYFKFSKSQRIGLFALLVLIVVFQAFYFFVDFSKPEADTTAKGKQWLSMQVPVDSLHKSAKENAPKIYPFNPNFISDFKGYKLGMSVAEIDRLLDFRKTNRYVNSAKEFQDVTLVSDSLLNAISPYFKFPDWVKNKKQYWQHKTFEKPETKVPLDINKATAEDLKKVYGIGDGLSARILKEKEKLGGFVNMSQMNDIWGLSPEVIDKLNKEFNVVETAEIRKIDINNATLKELMQFPYFRYALAKSIITYRSMNGPIKGAEDLIKISGFPIDKVEIIALYLEF